MEYDPQDLEERWRARWAEEGRYEPDPGEGEGAEPGSADGRAPDEREKTFVTVPYPYPSGGMHIGHARTYTVPDVYARYRRARGDSVLFPIAWHVTGTPIVGAVERLKKGEAAQMESLQQAFGVPDSDLESLETPMGYARYFIEEAESSYKRGMQSLGLSIDWRREFTTNDERYSRFITWQYETLRERGLLEKGLHPVKYCTEQENPVTTHDLLEGEEVEYQEYTLVKFQAGDRVFPMATLRPETVRGVTNAFVNPEERYVEAIVDGERWVVAEEAVEKLSLQDHDVRVEREVVGEELVGERVENPVTGDELTILPAGFVDPDSGSGVVMSVPAHSPDDYVALREVKDDPERLYEYGIGTEEVEGIEPIPILSIEGYGEIPARDAVEEAEITDSDDPRLAEITKELYTREFHAGQLFDAYGEFGGRVVEEVREELAASYREEGAFDAMYDFPEPVVSRAGGKVVVAYQDTWFLRYNDPQWREKTHRAVDRLDAIPENTREQYDHTIDWLNEWPCIRNYGLGTRLPWDDEFVIEPLSDSTIYMAYYTIAHRLSEIPPEELDREFFDALFYGADAVEEPDERALSLREEWSYWYPVDYRCSGNDLVPNHLTFFLYHHAELFDEPEWPGGITVMGMGLLEGEKMSSSKGHVVLPGDAIGEYGADTVRFFLMNSAEPWQDYDWRAEEVESTRRGLERFWNRAEELIDGPEGTRDLERIDRWLLAKLQETVHEVTEAMERFETRTASQAAFYNFEEHLRWYRRRTDLDRPGARWTLGHVLETRLRLLAPVVPFMANDLHERLTGEPAEAAPWPEGESEFESETVQAEESLVASLTDDVAEVASVTGKSPERIDVYVAADWKQEVFEEVVETGPDVGRVMGEVMSEPDLRERGDEVNQLVQELVEVVRGRSDEELATLVSLPEGEVYAEAREFFEREFDAAVRIVSEEETDDEKAGQARPLRPAIRLS
ncbi:leucine--tRNA ligase [Natronorarus salvus]|uniref:leucine--tRNA ligase n=1 Tax=Natronorarus salvus TaxID=3117733 RepID=UPI002F264857